MFVYNMYSIILIITIIASSKLSLIFRRISTGQGPKTGPARPGSAELRAGPVRADTSGSSGRSGPVQAAGATGRSGPGHYPCRARAAARPGPCRALLTPVKTTCVRAYIKINLLPAAQEAPNGSCRWGYIYLIEKRPQKKT